MEKHFWVDKSRRRLGDTLFPYSPSETLARIFTRPSHNFGEDRRVQPSSDNRLCDEVVINYWTRWEDQPPFKRTSHPFCPNRHWFFPKLLDTEADTASWPKTDHPPLSFSPESYRERLRKCPLQDEMVQLILQWLAVTMLCSIQARVHLGLLSR